MICSRNTTPLLPYLSLATPTLPPSLSAFVFLIVSCVDSCVVAVASWNKSPHDDGACHSNCKLRTHNRSP